MGAVAVTGGSGPLGRRVVPALVAEPGIDRVLEVADRGGADSTGAALKAAVAGVDTIVHLGLFGTPRPGQEADGVQLEGTRRVLEAAASSGARALVLVSSALVYGAWPNNPVPLTEDAAVRPNPGFAHALERAEAERLAAEWQDDHPGSTVALLRPVTVVGPGTDDWITWVFRDTFPLRVKGAGPPMQYVHADDLAAAVALAAGRGLDGVFNVAPDGWVSGDDIRALAAGRLRVSLPERVVRRVAGVGRVLGVSRMPAEVVPYLVHPWVVANDRLRAAGWMPRFTNEEALVDGAPMPAWQALSLQRRQLVALGAVAGVVGGAVSGAVALARRRSRR